MNLKIVDFSQANITALLAIPLAVLTFFVVIASLLVWRQARQMMEVLPTPLSPIVRIITIGYAIFALAIFILIIKTVFS